MLIRGTVIQNQVQFAIRRSSPVDELEELHLFSVTMPWLAVANILRSATFMAAKKRVVSWRTRSYVIVLVRPFFSGNLGCVRSRV